MMSVTASEDVVGSCISRTRHSTDVAMIWHTVSSVRTILWRLNHGRQLELLVIRIIAFLPCISLSVSQDFLIELYDLMYLISILWILLVSWLILNDVVDLRVVTLHQVNRFQAVAGDVPGLVSAVVLLLHVELREVVLSVDD